VAFQPAEENGGILMVGAVTPPEAEAILAELASVFFRDSAPDHSSDVHSPTGVIQAHEGRGQPEPFVFLHLPAQPRLRPRRLIPNADQLVIPSRLFDAGQVVPQVPVPLTRAKNGREVFSQLISGERQCATLVSQLICDSPSSDRGYEP
jgi:hypothetical protein